MYCPRCNNFVDDNREQCPFCGAQMKDSFNANTTERQVMEKIVSSKLYVVMAAALTLYTLFAAMSVILNLSLGGGFDIFNILTAIFGGILAWRVWTLYMGSVKKTVDNPPAEKMTAFFTCQKVLSIILAVVVGLGALTMFAVAVPYSGVVGDTLDKFISNDYSFKEVYDEIMLEASEESGVDVSEYEMAYDEFILSSGMSEDEWEDVWAEIKGSLIENKESSPYIKDMGYGQLFKIVVWVISVGLLLICITFVLLAIYMSIAVKFVIDFSVTWNGFAPWRRGSRYASGLGYFLSVILFIAALFGIFSLPNDISLLTNLAASVAMFCFAKFTAKVQKYMDELYRLNI